MNPNWHLFTPLLFILREFSQPLFKYPKSKGHAQTDDPDFELITAKRGGKNSFAYEIPVGIRTKLRTTRQLDR